MRQAGPSSDSALRCTGPTRATDGAIFATCGRMRPRFSWPTTAPTTRFPVSRIRPSMIRAVPAMLRRGPRAKSAPTLTGDERRLLHGRNHHVREALEPLHVRVVLQQSRTQEDECQVPLGIDPEERGTGAVITEGAG